MTSHTLKHKKITPENTEAPHIKEEDQSFNLDDNDIIDFFNTVVTRKDPSPSKSPQEKNYPINSTDEWSQAFVWDNDIRRANQLIFGHKGFKKNQLEVINAAKAKRDVLGVLPTGSGKSLTFQISAITDKGITFAIMPLLSLTLDQTNYLEVIGVNALFFKSGMDTYSLRSDLLRIKSETKLVYLTPEKLAQTNELMTLLEELYTTNRLARFVIDEAHCISQWGKEFRRDYLGLSILRKRFPDVPILALTATATPITRDDICMKLGLQNPVIIQGKFGRDNIFYEVRPKVKIQSVIKDITTFIREVYPSESGIIYCSSKRECEQLSKNLKSNSQIQCGYYHGGMGDVERKLVQQEWMENKIQLVVATTAFGLGINKPNVRYIIHYSMPKSMEYYVQECGRAGRDGLTSHCIMYYDITDKKVHDYLLLQGKEQHESSAVMKYAQSNIHRMIEYCEELYICRRQIQAEYFKEEFVETECKSMCDNCKLRKSSGVLKFFNKEAKIMVDLLRDVIDRRKRITLLQLVHYLHGKNRHNVLYIEGPSMIKFFGTLKDTPLNVLRTIIIKLLINNVLREDLCQVKEKAVAYLELDENELALELEELVISFVVGKPVTHKNLRELLQKEVFRFCFPVSQKPIKASPDKKKELDVLKNSEIRSKLKDKDIKYLTDKLMYEKVKLGLKNKTDKKFIDSVFNFQSIIEITNNIPKDLYELRLILEKKNWMGEEEAVFIKYGGHFIHVIAKYLNVCLISTKPLYTLTTEELP